MFGIAVEPLSKLLYHWNICEGVSRIEQIHKNIQGARHSTLFHNCNQTLTDNAVVLSNREIEGVSKRHYQAEELVPDLGEREHFR
jgi:hypothetical protein